MSPINSDFMVVAGTSNIVSLPSHGDVKVAHEFRFGDFSSFVGFESVLVVAKQRAIEIALLMAVDTGIFAHWLTVKALAHNS
jgi:hypothetical protein